MKKTYIPLPKGWDQYIADITVPIGLPPKEEGWASVEDIAKVSGRTVKTTRARLRDDEKKGRLESQTRLVGRCYMKFYRPVTGQKNPRKQSPSLSLT